MKRKIRTDKDQPNLKRLRCDVEKLSHESATAVSGWDATRKTRTKSLSRKEKRKEARLLKKSRKLAYAQRREIPIISDAALKRREEEKIQKEKENKKKIKEKEKEKKSRRARVAEKAESARQECLREDMKRDDKEIKDLEKKLHLNKRKSKSLPQSFLDDGLDYLLDLVSGSDLNGLQEELERERVEMESEAWAEEGENEFDSNSGLNSDSEDSDSNPEQARTDSEEASTDTEDSESPVGEHGPRKSKPSEKKATGSILKAQSQAVEKPDTNSQSKTAKHVKWADNEESDRLAGRQILTRVDGDDSDNSDDDEEDDFSDDDCDFDGDEGDFESEEEEEEGEEEEEIGNLKNPKRSSLEQAKINSSKSQASRKTKETAVSKDSSQTSALKEDIYGRLRDEEGNIVTAPSQSGTYVPPAKRMMLADQDEKKRLELERLRKQLKGLVNRASEANIQPISSQVEELYLRNSRADVNDCLLGLVFEACISPVVTPERLVMELIMLIAILHGNVGSEVGATCLQRLIQKLTSLMDLSGYGEGKEIDNGLMMLAHLFNFKVVHSVLVFDVIDKLLEKFSERDVELILLLLRHVGFTLRKEDPDGLRRSILKIQAEANGESGARLADQSRVRFMLEIILAIRNNNMRKIPNYDPEHLNHLKKLTRNFVKGGKFGDNQLYITLQDLLNAETKGKWWVVGSAWEGQGPRQEVKGVESRGSSGVQVSDRLVELARRQRMNTDVRRNIFFILMTSEDYIDAFEKLLRLGLKGQQQREIITVILDCCLQEKQFNPYYAFLAHQWCEFDRKHQMTLQFNVWDKFKEITRLAETARVNLGKLLTHLCASKALSLSIFKTVSFGTLEKPMVHLLKQVLTDLLTEHPAATVEAAFERIAKIDKLHLLHEGLKLFLHHFVLGKKREPGTNTLIEERIEMIDRIFQYTKGGQLL